MTLKELAIKNRSFRIFDESRPISPELLRELVDTARICPSTANRQPLKYKIITAAEERERLYPSLAWAGYLKEWDGPQAGKRPSGYVMILNDDAIAKDSGLDAGICAQTMLLGAAEAGFGGCMIGSLKREEIRSNFAIPETQQILLVIAFGAPAEEVVLEETGAEGSIRYYRDDQQRHHVPKRPLSEVLLG